jgi:multifunctional 2-oxoglutarate metabolism enzyme
LKNLEALFGPNAALVEELYKQYKEDDSSVPEHWRNYFDEMDGVKRLPETPAKAAATNGAPVAIEEEPEVKKAPERKAVPAKDRVEAEKEEAGKEADRKKPPAKKAPPLPDGVELTRIKGVAAKISENMEDSLRIPTATSLRVLPVKMLMEDRTIINSYLEQRGEPKASLTHFISWAVIKALEDFPMMNHFYFEDEEGNPHRAVPSQVNLGIAVDVEGRDGNRSLVVPNIKGVDKMNFYEFLYAYQEVIDKAKNGKLEISDFEGTTISITNPGTIGTVSSMPRLMGRQGTIIATGAMNYPAEFQGMAPELLNHLGISRTMTVTSTYDHRIIQGAESGSFLKRINDLLIGELNFFDQIFADLNIPYDPIPYGRDIYTGLFDGRGSTTDATKKAIAVMHLISMYRTHGHMLADLNPLKHGPGHNPELDFEYHGLTMWDLDREFYCGGLGGFDNAKLRVIVKLLRETYCRHIGAEFMHILNLDERNWLMERMESTTNTPNLSKEEKTEILHKLNQASAFEEFLHKKYVGHKRFSLEGADTVIPALHFMLKKCAEYEVQEVVFGMAHRGRLNVLVNLMNKSYRQVFSEFEGYIDPASAQGTGDVKYHLGTRGEFDAGDGSKVDLVLMPNPSHLESVNPVVEGAVRAKQDRMNDPDAWKKIVPLLIHGDAAFAGQGVVAETLNMSQLDGYKTGGTIHLIINNQIGFTTLPKDGRSTQYASDLAKMILAPIFHVNGDDPEAAVHAMRLALEYRQKFGKDVVIDLICYRKHGHNEGDEPGFTQPSLYREIKDHKSVREIYTAELLRKNELTKNEVDTLFKEFEDLLEEAFNEAKSLPQAELSKKLLERDEQKQKDWGDDPDTTFPIDRLKEIAYMLNKVSDDFDANPKLLRILAKRNEIVEKEEKKIEWGYAEALAFGSLLVENVPVRLSGQDSERGTFSHRHAVLHGTETLQQYVPLNNLANDQALFCVYNSHLSEFAALGFEFGYSTAKPEALVLWEAQFGDFVNGAQIIIDQYIAASEAKWRQNSSLVMLLPHGYEGQGPEHSSGRLERFLQLCAEDNMQVANCTTPAQFYHLLRRQALQKKKKPLIVMTPKSLLRHPLAVSNTTDLAEGRFQAVIPDEYANPDDVNRVVFCSGKLYYDLYNYRMEHKIENTAVVRLEQYYPFPDKDIARVLEGYSNLEHVVWCQEEPRNMGAWSFVRPRFETVFEAATENLHIRYEGRQASASPAAGSQVLHQAEQERLIKAAFE